MALSFLFYALEQRFLTFLAPRPHQTFLVSTVTPKTKNLTKQPGLLKHVCQYSMGWLKLLRSHHAIKTRTNARGSTSCQRRSQAYCVPSFSELPSAKEPELGTVRLKIHSNFVPALQYIFMHKIVVKPYLSLSMTLLRYHVHVDVRVMTVFTITRQQLLEN